MKNLKVRWIKQIAGNQVFSIFYCGCKQSNLSTDIVRKVRNKIWHKQQKDEYKIPWSECYSKPTSSYIKKIYIPNGVKYGNLK